MAQSERNIDVVDNRKQGRRDYPTAELPGEQNANRTQQGNECECPNTGQGVLVPFPL